MNIRKLPSGNYQLRQTYNGIEYKTTIDHKPTNKEAVMIMAELLKNEATDATTGTLFDSITAYMDAKRNSLEESTKRGYLTYQNAIPEKYAKMRLYDINNVVLQKLASDIMDDHTVKYAKNILGLIRAVLALYRPDFQFRVSYTNVTKRDQNKPYIPTEDDVKRIIEYAKGTKFEIPLLLASTCGLRRGEVCALTVDDFDENNFVTINKDKVLDSKGNWIIKPPKSKSGIRRFHVEDQIVDLIRAQGYVYEGNPDSIYHFLQKAQSALGIKQFSLHKLRHFYCSKLSAEGIDEACILFILGWSTSKPMKEIYRHPDTADEKLKKISEIGSSWLKSKEKNIISRDELIELLKKLPSDTTFTVKDNKVSVDIK